MHFSGASGLPVPGCWFLIKLLYGLVMFRLKSVSNSVHAWTQQGSTSVCITFWVVFGIDGLSQLPIVCRSVHGYLWVKSDSKGSFALQCKSTAKSIVSMERFLRPASL